MMEITEAVGPLRGVKRNELPPWWTSQVRKAMKQKQPTFMRCKSTNGYRSGLEDKLAGRELLHA